MPQNHLQVATSDCTLQSSSKTASPSKIPRLLQLQTAISATDCLVLPIQDHNSQSQTHSQHQLSDLSLISSVPSPFSSPELLSAGLDPLPLTSNSSQQSSQLIFPQLPAIQASNLSTGGNLQATVPPLALVSSTQITPPTPIIPTTSHLTVLQLTGKVAMPALGSKKAPRTFNGDEGEIAEFIEVYERCVDDVQLEKKDWVKFLFQYLARGQREIFKTFDGYDITDWAVFRTAIEEAFAGAFKTRRHTLLLFNLFISTTAQQPIHSDTELWAYHRKFQAIVVYPICEKELLDSDKNCKYWFGLHPDTRMSIERQPTITIPDHPRSKPFSVADVYKAGCYVFDSNTFDLNIPTTVPSNTLIQTATNSLSQGNPSESRVVKKIVNLPSSSV
ncbi:hypothetical protein K439DRAFT_1622186 [Ramaria rubella]|nr:hypothetical protein K439DRAFT_1622186 [Ramaria rubella]